MQKLSVRIAVAMAAAAVSTCAMADITAFVAPVASGGGSSGASFTQLSATGFYFAGMGAFDNHWLLTVDSANPLLTITVENSFNPRTGGGALGFDTMTFTGPGIAGVALTPASPPCVVGPVPADCITRRTGTFAVMAGSYDLDISGSNPFNGSYRVAIAVVPEPATPWLFAAGLCGWGWAGRRRQERATGLMSKCGSATLLIPPRGAAGKAGLGAL